MTSPENVKYLYGEEAAVRYIARNVAHDGWANIRSTGHLKDPSGSRVWSDTRDGDEVYTETGHLVGTWDIPVNSDWSEGTYTFEMMVEDQKSGDTRSDTVKLTVTSDNDVSPKIVIHSQHEQERGITDEFPIFLYGFTHRGNYNIKIWQRMFNPDGDQVFDEPFQGNPEGRAEGRLKDKIGFTASSGSSAGEYIFEYEIEDIIAENTYKATKKIQIK
ncbi:MAG: hypothetical protein SVV03_04285 [Candidatus Nanohaloarchaea archaeon]|nr:hypothetical protein [Candidatus Nanohaloarchaea archaeon]